MGRGTHNFVDEDDGRGLLPGVLEDLPHPLRAGADEHLVHLRPRDAEEAAAGRPRDGPRQHGLPWTRGRRVYQCARSGSGATVAALTVDKSSTYLLFFRKFA